MNARCRQLLSAAVANSVPTSRVLVVTSSSEFKLPAGDTQSEGDAGAGDSTLDLPDMDALPARKERSSSPGSTVFGNYLG